MLILGNFDMATIVEIPCFGTFKKLIQNRFGYVQIKTNLAGHSLGVKRNHLLAHVVKVKQASVRQVLCIAEMHCVGEVVTNVKFVPYHFAVFPKMSGRSSALFTFLPVCNSMSRASSGLGSRRPVTINENHVLLMPRVRAIAIIVPLGLSEKYSVKVIGFLSWLSGCYTKKNCCATPD
jgi:hypothetical protein